MTAYRLSPPSTLPSFAIQQAKEKRRKVLAAVRERRKSIYHRFYQKILTNKQAEL